MDADISIDPITIVALEQLLYSDPCEFCKSKDCKGRKRELSPESP